MSKWSVKEEDKDQDDDLKQNTVKAPETLNLLSKVMVFLDLLYKN